LYYFLPFVFTAGVMRGGSGFEKLHKGGCPSQVADASAACVDAGQGPAAPPKFCIENPVREKVSGYWTSRLFRENAS